MSSIRDDWVTLDTNVWVLGLSGADAACEHLVQETAGELRLFVPRQVAAEIRQNLGDAGASDMFRALQRARAWQVLYDDAPEHLKHKYLSLGAKKGDARICAELEVAGVRWLISENRHFLAEIPALPFTVLTADQSLKLLLREE